MMNWTFRTWKFTQEKQCMNELNWNTIAVRLWSTTCLTKLVSCSSTSLREDGWIILPIREEPSEWCLKGTYLCIHELARHIYSYSSIHISMVWKSIKVDESTAWKTLMMNICRFKTVGWRKEPIEMFQLVSFITLVLVFYNGFTPSVNITFALKFVHVKFLPMWGSPRIRPGSI